MYTPQAQLTDSFLTLVIRSGGDPSALAGEARRAIWSVASDVPVYEVAPLVDLVQRSVGPRRFVMVLLELFGAVALLMTAIGVYGVISYSVARRTTEFGIRMAIGADSRRILRMVMRQGVLLGGTGVLVGVLAALWLTRFMKAILFGIQPLDVPTFAGTVVLLLAVTLLASWRPARRATRVDPAVALRYE